MQKILSILLSLIVLNSYAQSTNNSIGIGIGSIVYLPTS
jgi:hypothetical protein